jgi:hypothetical protein
MNRTLIAPVPTSRSARRVARADPRACDVSDSSGQDCCGHARDGSARASWSDDQRVLQHGRARRDSITRTPLYYEPA